MRLIAALALAGAFLTGAAPPPEAELQRAADQLVATTAIPGVITLVEQDGQRVTVASGHAEVGGRLARPEDRFWVGSVTKTFVATVVMQLVAQHRIRLDDKVRRYLPGRLQAGRRIRVRNLLNHSSGLPDYMLHEPWISTIAGDPRAVIPARKLVSSVAKLPLEYRPGSRATYSNTNYLVLGEILERVTHRSVASLLQRRIFTPLGLADTAFESARDPLPPDQMHGYDIRITPPMDVSLDRLGGPWADGAVVSNARDLVVFFGALLRGQIVPPSLVAQMRKPFPGSHGNGLGLFKLGSPCGRWFFGNTGGTPGYLTFVAGTRDGRRLFVFAVNGVDPSAMEQIAGPYLDNLLCRD
jgi:D-alanyl-D-alanine carboxypeptidase